MTSSSATVQLFLYSQSFAATEVQRLIPGSPISVDLPHEHEFYDWMASKIARIPWIGAIRFQKILALQWEPIPHVDDLVPCAMLIGLYPFEIDGEVLRRLNWAISYRNDMAREYASNSKLYEQYTRRTRELALAHNVLVFVNCVRADWRSRADNELREEDVSNTEILAERWTAATNFPASVENDVTIPQPSLNNRSINYARGKVLGGSSAINMCAYTVGPKDDYDHWAKMVGDEDFGWANAVRIRKEKLESFDDRIGEEYVKYAEPDMCVHGKHGSIDVSLPKVWERSITIQLDTAKASGLGINLDINSGNPLGMASVPSTAKDGRRITAANAYLRNAPRNLTIMADHQAVKILFDGKKAVGITVANGDEYRASKDIIISAGAVDTPKILMLSGIGDTTELAKHNIETIHHLPRVGKNLQDHLSIAFCRKQKEGLVDWSQHFSNPEAVRNAQAQFEKDDTGPLSVFFQGLTMGFFKADEVLQSQEFVELNEEVKGHLRKETVPIWELSCHIPPCTSKALAAPENNYLTLFAFLHNPQSKGTVTLSSDDFASRPIIDPKFFSHPFDRLCALAATKRALAFIQHPLIASNLDIPVDAPTSDNEDDVLEFWENGAGSTWHPSCTVKMGRDGDEEACVDSDFRVRGVQSLRVADLSVLPFLLSCHPASVAYLVGEIAAEKISSNHGLDA